MLEESESWSEIVEAVQSRSLKEVAAEHGVRPGALSAALIRAGVRRQPVPAEGAAPPPRKVRKKRAASTAAPAEVNGLDVRGGTKDAEIAKHKELLGVEPDHVIAEKAGVSARTVASFRRRHGIKGRRGRGPARSEDLPPEKSTAKKERKKPGRKSRIDPFADQLGTRPDAEIAELAGVSTNAVAAYRRRRGVTAHRDAQREVPEVAAAAPEAPAPAAAPAPKATPRPAAPTSGGQVYRVSISGAADAFVLADSLVAAAQAVEGRKGVVGVAFAGSLLA